MRLDELITGEMMINGDAEGVWLKDRPISPRQHWLDCLVSKQIALMKVLYPSIKVFEIWSHQFIGFARSDLEMTKISQGASKIHRQQVMEMRFESGKRKERRAQTAVHCKRSEVQQILTFVEWLIIFS